jgi:hypothetical protein
MASTPFPGFLGIGVDYAGEEIVKEVGNRSSFKTTNF